MAHDLPIVLIHYGRSPYLLYTAGRAKMVNPTSPVVVIGDSANSGYMPFVEHVHMGNYARQAAELQKVYRHFSPNNEVYELFCFQRWFILRDFMRTHGLRRLIHLDSDVLVNVNVQAESRNWEDYGLTLVRQVCAGNMFVNGIEMIEAMCDLIWGLYVGPGAEDRLDAIRTLGNGANCDMSAFRQLCAEHPTRIGEMTGVQPDGSYWDANIHLDEGFETADGVKAIRWVGGRPYARHVASGRDVWFKSLHYQGVGKARIESAFRNAHPTPVAAPVAA